MRISESVLRKIIREEIESISEADVIGLNSALGMSPAEIQGALATIGTLIGVVGGHIAATSKSGKKVDELVVNAGEKAKKAVESLLSILSGGKDGPMNEVDMDINQLSDNLGSLKQVLDFVGLIGPVGVGIATAGAAKDLTTDAVDKAKQILQQVYGSLSGNRSINQDNPRP
jgi:hypothetical protein